MDLQPSGCPLLIPGPSTEPATLEVVPTSRPNQLCWSELPSSPPFHTRAKRVELVPAVSCFAFHTGTLAVPGRPRRPSPGHRRSHWRLHPPPPTCFPLPPRLSASRVGFVPLAAVGGLESAGTASPCRGPLAAHPPPPSPYQCPISPCVHHSILSLARRDRGPRLRFLSRRVDPAGALYQPLPPSTTV